VTDPPAPVRRTPVRRGISEFGELLAGLIESIPGARGAALSDARGEPIDFAHRPADISELDIQIAPAQVGQALARLQRNATARGLGQADLVIEGERATLLASQLLSEYVVTLVLAPDCNLARATDRFARARQTLDEMLR
jgi:predicted regulator of Ras-like GTPase activity (Roadblock/LC7/MglB family)